MPATFFSQSQSQIYKTDPELSPQAEKSVFRLPLRVAVIFFSVRRNWKQAEGADVIGRENIAPAVTSR